MSAVPARVHAGGCGRGGVAAYPLEQLVEEVGYVAYHYHWAHDDIMSLEHAERRRWVGAISALNQRINEGAT